MDPNQQVQPAQTEPIVQQQSGMSENTRTMITVLLLVFALPVGVIFMWVWMKKWPTWGKVIITVPFAIAFILIIISGIIVFVINPVRHSSQLDNTMRSSDVNAILNSVNQYQAENNGKLPAGITTRVQNISTSGADICAVLVPSYMVALPVDPSVKNGKAITDCAAEYDTGYAIVQGAGDNKVTVSAPAAGDKSIEASR